MDPKEIWKGLATELIDNFDLSLRTRKAELELNSYVYSYESADDYINKIRDLTRKVNGSATEQRILKNLYDHLPQKMKLVMGPGPWHKKLLISVLDLQLSLRTCKVRRRQKLNPIAFHSQQQRKIGRLIYAVCQSVLSVVSVVAAHTKPLIAGIYAKSSLN